MTDDSLDLFIKLAEAAEDWGGTPPINISQEQKGNLSDLKNRGLVETFEVSDRIHCRFTEAGAVLAAEYDLEVDS